MIIDKTKVSEGQIKMLIFRYVEDFLCRLLFYPIEENNFKLRRYNAYLDKTVSCNNRGIKIKVMVVSCSGYF